MKSILLVGISLFIIFFTTSAQDNQASVLKTKKESWEFIHHFFTPPKEYVDKFGTYKSPLEFYEGKKVKNHQDWIKRRAEIVNKWNGIMGVWPPFIKDQSLQVVDSIKKFGYMQYTVTFSWTPNARTKGYLLIPEGGEIKPAVISVFYEPETAIGQGKSERTKTTADFSIQLVKRGFVALSIGTTEETKAGIYSLYYPGIDNAKVEPLSMLAYAAANAWYALSKRPEVDSARIGIMGLSFGGKWAMFASCLFDKFACAVWSDPGIVFDDSVANINYWEPWYLGYHPRPWRKSGLITKDNPAKGAYVELRSGGYDLQELHALMAPRPFLVSGGSEDKINRWVPLNHAIAVNKFLGYKNRVALTNREGHLPTAEANEQAYSFFDYFLKYKLPKGAK